LAENIGGRFSVFSVVGLVPLAMVGELSLFISTKVCKYLNKLMVSIVLPDFEITTKCASKISNLVRQ
jgi:hypothetical protein